MSPLSNSEGWYRYHCWTRLGLELIVVIGRVGANVVTLEVAGAQVFVVGEKLGQDISKPTFFSYRHYSSHRLVQVCTALADSQTLYKGVGEAVDTHLLCPAWPIILQLCIYTGNLTN